MREILGGRGKTFLLVSSEKIEILNIRNNKTKRIGVEIQEEKVIFLSEEPIGKEDLYLIGFSDGSMGCISFVRNQEDMEIKSIIVNNSSLNIKANSIAQIGSFQSFVVLFLASETGDSAVAMLDIEEKKIKVVNRLNSCGPIVDFAYINETKRRSKLAVVGMNSIHVLSEGKYFFNEMSFFQPNVSRVWLFQSDIKTSKNIMICTGGSPIKETNEKRKRDEEPEEFTKLISFDPVNCISTEESGFDGSSVSLYINKTKKSNIIQVTNKEVRLISIDDFKLIKKWIPEKNSPIYCSDGMENYVLACSSDRVNYFEIENLQVNLVNFFKLGKSHGTIKHTIFYKANKRNYFLGISSFNHLIVRKIPQFTDTDIEIPFELSKKADKKILSFAVNKTQKQDYLIILYQQGIFFNFQNKKSFNFF